MFGSGSFGLAEVAVTAGVLFIIGAIIFPRFLSGRSGVIFYVSYCTVTLAVALATITVYVFTSTAGGR